MAYEMKDNSGSLFKNERREKDTHAHAKGTALIEGVEYWVDAWTNEARDGSKYQSLKFKRKEPAQGYTGSYNGDPATNRSGGTGGAPMQRSANPQAFDPDLDDDVPFARCDTALEHRVG